jgi:hypothetical protein
MSNRFDNKRLIFILGGLLVILLVTVIVKIPKEKSTLKERLVDIDTSSVYRIMLIPKVTEGKPFEFVKENEKWTVRQGNITSTPMKGSVTNVFEEILAIKPQSLAAVGKSKWQEYELTDSLATRVKFLNKKGKNVADLMIGRFTYKQVNNPYAAYGGNNIEGTSFVRLFGEEKVYAVEGFLAFSFNGKFNDWRDKSFLKCKKEDLTKITFTMPSDSSFILTKKDSLWFEGNQPTDSLNTSNYLNSIGYIDGQDFRDEYKPASPPAYQLIIEGNNLLNITVKCFKGDGEDKYILNSSLNPDVYFTSDKNGIFNQLFKSQSYFLKQAKKQ